MTKIKEEQEKNKIPAEEKHKHDPLSGIKGGLILILLGILFLLVTLDYISWGEWLNFFLVGLGAIMILEAMLGITSPAYRHHTTGKMIGGIVLIIIGASRFFGLETWWPLILIGVGVVLLFSSLMKRKPE